MTVGLVKIGFAGKDFWQQGKRLRTGPEGRFSFVPVQPELVAGFKFFGRYRGGWIHDGVPVSVG